MLFIIVLHIRNVSSDVMHLTGNSVFTHVLQALLNPPIWKCYCSSTYNTGVILLPLSAPLSDMLSEKEQKPCLMSNEVQRTGAEKREGCCLILLLQESVFQKMHGCTSHVVVLDM